MTTRCQSARSAALDRALMWNEAHRPGQGWGQRLIILVIAMLAVMSGLVAVAQAASAVGPAAICVYDTVTYTYESDAHTSPGSAASMSWRGPPAMPVAAQVVGSDSLSGFGVATKAVGPDIAEGLNPFSAAKRALGSPGAGNVYDHVVEQSQIARSGFAPELVHNPYNMKPVPAWANQVKANYYSRKFDWTNGGTVRDWLSGQSYEAQHSFGLRVLDDIQAGAIR